MTVADHFDNPSDAPGGYLLSSARDMTHFVIAQLTGGRYNGRQVVSPSAVEAMHANAVRVSASETYGLGWTQGRQDGVPAVYHYGTNYDGETFVVLEPQLHRGAVLLLTGQSLLAATPVRNVETGLARLVAGKRPPAEAMSVRTVYAEFDLGVVLLLTTAAVALARIRRWRRRPGLASHRRRGWVRAVAEGTLGIVLFGGLRFVFAQLGAEWFQMLRAAPDVVVAAAVLSAVLMTTAVVRSVVLVRTAVAPAT